MLARAVALVREDSAHKLKGFKIGVSSSKKKKLSRPQRCKLLYPSNQAGPGNVNQCFQKDNSFLCPGKY